MTTVYVLFGDTGEYSDHSEWVVCAYEHQADADADCAFLNERAKGLEDLPWTERDAAVAERLTPHDANASCDYTGVRYTVAAVEVYGVRRTATRDEPPEDAA